MDRHGKTSDLTHRPAMRLNFMDPSQRRLDNPGESSGLGQHARRIICGFMSHMRSSKHSRDARATKKRVRHPNFVTAMVRLQLLSTLPLQ